MKNISISTGKMVRLAVLVAVLLVMAYTPLGYLKVGAVEISFMMIPVVIGTVIIGPGAGAFLGGVFGITSFIQCFGASPFGAALLGINPWFTFITCMIPRILAGWLPGLLFKALGRTKLPKWVPITAACLSGALLNTIFFVAFLFLLFGGTDFVRSFGENVWAITVLLVGVNGLVEAAVSSIAGAAVSGALLYFLPEREKRS